MPTNTLNGRSFDVDAEGFLTDRDQWSESLAADLAGLIGLEMNDDRWAPIRFMREDSSQTGTTPTLRRMQIDQGPVRVVPRQARQEDVVDRRPAQARRLRLTDHRA